jgi:hypothetical protein
LVLFASRQKECKVKREGKLAAKDAPLAPPSKD